MGSTTMASTSIRRVAIAHRFSGHTTAPASGWRCVPAPWARISSGRLYRSGRAIRRSRPRSSSPPVPCARFRPWLRRGSSRLTRRGHRSSGDETRHRLFTSRLAGRVLSDPRRLVQVERFGDVHRIPGHLHDRQHERPVVGEVDVLAVEPQGVVRDGVEEPVPERAQVLPDVAAPVSA